ncbi:MAG: hypothetical protein V4726_13115 [Verrucomicrobiota bacterium]
MNYSSTRRKLGLWAALLLLAGAVWLGVYVYDSGFTRKWRTMIARELAKHGLRADIGRLTLDPVEGLTARDVKIYDMTHRDQHLADINSISLDIDLTRMLNHEPFLRTIHLQQADMALPVDPGDPKSEWLTVQGLTARLVFRDDRIEIARADGVVSGIHVKVSGSLKKGASKSETPEEKSRRQEERTRQIREMRDRRGALRSVLRVLDRFQVASGPDGTTPAHKAELELDVQGDPGDIENLEVRASLSGGPLKFPGGKVESLRAEAGLSGGLVTLKSLELHDSKGAFHAGASWKIKAMPAVVDLAVESGIDWQPLLRTALDEAPWLGEVVCYSAPEFEWEGKWFPGGGPEQGAGGGQEPPEQGPPGKWPLEGQGHLKARRFSTRGVVFEGLEARFAVKTDGTLYIREGLLTHHTGTVRGQMLAGPGGSRYELEWLMSVNAAAPFIANPVLRGVLERFAFQNQSRVGVRMAGKKENGADWHHRGRVEMLDFSYQKTPLHEVSADVTVDSTATPPVRFTGVKVRMDEGTGTAREVGLDFASRLLWITEGSSTLVPARFINLFLPALAQELTKYRFAQAPAVTIDGVIDLKGLDRSDYTIHLKTRSRCGLDIANSPYEFDGVSGTAHILGPRLLLQLTGSTVAGTVAFNAVRLDDAAPAVFDGTFSLLKERRPPPAWNVKITSPGRVSVLVLRRTWPLDQFVGRLACADNRLEVTGGATLFGGKFGASMEFPETSKPAHNASIVLDRVSFARLTRIVDATRKTEGWISGNFSYRMETARPETLSGTGKVSLEDGNIFALPLLGPLSGLLKALLPGESDIGYSVARSATATVTVAAGKVMLPDFEAATGTFRLKANGTVDYIRDKVDFLARVNLRGPPGLLLLPVSKLLEYTASGTMAEPDWHARFLSNPFRKSSSATDADDDDNNDKGPARADPAPPLVPVSRPVR